MDSNKSFSEVVRAFLIPGQVSVLGITGQAGAGKTTFIASLAAGVAQEEGFATDSLGLDAFFKLSSSGRKEWIKEGHEISPEEGAFRSDQVNWWDFGDAQKALEMLKRGEPIHLTNVYNREDEGELTGEVMIHPPDGGMLLVFEGVAVAHLDCMDALMYVHAPSAVRFERLYERDKERRGREEALGRFELTQAFETQYFPQYWDKITCFVDNSQQYPQVLGCMKHEIALT
jgi:uridine kinase